MNTTPYINRSSVKKLALHYSASNRAGKFTRVSKDFLERINAKVAGIISEEVHRHPSIGKTLM
jgi:hypothetical protein